MKKSSPRSDFYVYALFRPDTGEPFYIGKGSGKRIRATLTRIGQNPFKDNIINMVKRQGLQIPIVKIATGLTEAESFAVESAFIGAIGRDPVGPLTNITDGGGGTAGLLATPQHRAKISAALKGRRQSQEWIAKRIAASSASRVGVKTGPQTPEWIAKRTAANSTRVWTDASRKKLSESATVRNPNLVEANKARVWTDEMRAKVGEASRARIALAGGFGKKIPC